MKIVFTPDWFLGSDVLIEIFSFIILALFFYLAVKNYKLSKNKKLLYLGIGFLLIAIGELATTLTKFILYYDTSFTQTIGKAIITYNVVNSVDIFYYIGFFFHKLFTLLGLFILYRMPLKKRSTSEIILALYIIFVSVLFSQSVYYLFHLTALGLLLLIMRNYYEVYKKNKSQNTKILIEAFSLLALSQMLFLVSGVDALYALAQIVQLVSYIILLVLIIRIIKNPKLQHGKKKKSGGYNIRHAGNNKRK